MVATFGAYTWTFFLPLYFSKVFHTSSAEIGLVYTAWLLMIGAGAAPAGALADRYGRKGIVVLAGAVSSAGVFLLAFSHSFVLDAVAFSLTGLGTSFLSVQNVMIAESVQEEKRGSAFGNFLTLTYALRSFSPFIGGLLLNVSQSYFFVLFIFGGSLAVFSTILRLVFGRETLRKRNLATMSDVATDETKKSSYLQNLSRIFTNRILLTLIIVYSLYNLIVDQASYILPLYGQYQLDLNTETLGILFALVTAISGFTPLYFGRMSDRIGRLKTIVISWIGESLTIFIFVFAPKGDLLIALVGIAVWSTFGVMDAPAVNAWLADSTDAKARGLSMGSFYSAAFLVAVPFFSVAGFLYTIDPKLPFYANSILGVCALVLLVGLTKPQVDRHATMNGEV
jgi:DHA1 family multidrug resistance protein-like MFS transporter